MSLTDLNGQPIQSEQAVEEQRKKAMEEFQKILSDLAEKRIPLVEGLPSDKLKDIETRLHLLRMVAGMTYFQPITKPVRNNKGEVEYKISEVLSLPVLDQRQIAFLSMRVNELAELL